MRGGDDAPASVCRRLSTPSSSLSVRAPHAPRLGRRSRAAARRAHLRACPTDVAVPPVGARVLVPLGTRMITGCVLGTADGAAAKAPPGHEDQGRRRRPGRSSRSCRPTSSRWRRGSRSTTRAASAKRSPPRCRRAPGSRASATRTSPTPAAQAHRRPSVALRRTVLDEARGRRAGPRRRRLTRRAAASTPRSSRSSGTAWSR